MPGIPRTAARAPHGRFCQYKNLLMPHIYVGTKTLVEITFDPRNNALNIANHGYDFATIIVEFFSSATILDARAGRFNAIGEFDGRVISVVFKPLGIQGLSVISMRRASRKERAIYDQA
jgi:uncharacterized DUF497 family protein